MILLNKYYNGLLTHCDECGALLGYTPADIYEHHYIYCIQCHNKISVPLDLSYDGLIREEKPTNETVV